MTPPEPTLPVPNIQCARCHGALSDHLPTWTGDLWHAGRECYLSAEQLVDQVYAWADYALGNEDRARERNYRLRTGVPA